MGTIAEKLTYLNTTKEKIRDSINLTGANIGTSDTFRSYASKLKKGYIDIINNGIDTLYNNFPKVSGIGSNLSLTPTYEAPIKLNEIQGDTLQNGTPTPDTPVEIQSVTGLQNVEVCGKNLLNIPNGTYSNNGITAVSSNGIITLNGTATDTSFITITLLKEIVVANQTLTISNNNQENISDNLTEVRLFTTVGNYIPCSFKQINNSTTRTNLTDTYNRLQIRTSSGVSFENFIIKPQLEKGSTATEYEPYKSNTYEVNLGKNLFDKNDITTGLYYYASGTSVSVNWAIAQVQVQPNTNYYLSGNNYNNDTARIVLLDSSKNITNDLGGYKNVHLITTNSNTAYIGLSIANYEGSSDLSSIQLEKGSTASSYSSYFTPIELNKIGDYQDRIYKDNGKWYLEKQIGKVVLNGSEAWGYDSNSLFFVSSNAISNYSRSNNIPYCDYYKGVSNVNGGSNISNNQIALNTNTSNDRLYIKNSNITNQNDFTTWLSTHNTIVYYVLATPTYTEITNTELIEDLKTLYTAKSQEGTTNISITSEDLEMILNISVLEGDVE